jgi:hypothetical protein
MCYPGRLEGVPEIDRTRTPGWKGKRLLLHGEIAKGLLESGWVCPFLLCEKDCDL